MKKIAVLIALLGGLLLTGCAAPQEVSTKPGAPTSAAKAGGSEEPDEGDNVTKVGTWATAEDGLSFRVAKLKRAKVGAYAAGGKPGGPAVIVTVQIRNTGKTRFDTTMFQIGTRVGADGTEADQVFDSERGYGDGFTGTVAPGRTATVKYMFAAEGAADLKTVSVELTPGFEYESFTFEGAAT
ncbi:hypothetical protein [Actinomadura sp. 3N508]|uniref:hypothetical protein n=1 Tax=Actinomadura sp. 3N508 TaxID=3375153 RepID=UPI00379832EC